MSETAVVRTPKHLWVVGALALLWNFMGAVDYVLTQFHYEPYLSQFTPEQLAYFYAYPAWRVALWALGVWGALFGVVLLLMRKRLAVTVLLISFLCVVEKTASNFARSEDRAIIGMEGLVFTVVIFLVSLGLVIYSRNMARRGVLV